MPGGPVLSNGTLTLSFKRRIEQALAIRAVSDVEHGHRPVCSHQKAVVIVVWEEGYFSQRDEVLGMGTVGMVHSHGSRVGQLWMGVLRGILMVSS